MVGVMPMEEYEPSLCSPGQEPVDELLLLLYEARPIALDVPVMLLLQRVAQVLGVKFSNLEISRPRMSKIRQKENKAD
jgi:hypothetical protein